MLRQHLIIVWSVNHEIINIHLRTVNALEKILGTLTIFLVSIFDYDKLKYYLFSLLKLKKNSMALLDSSIPSVFLYL